MKTQKEKQKAFIVVGLGYGDEGKGSMTDFLCRLHGAGLVVRYNGGSQAAHNVVTDDNQHHTFSQVGSGTFVPGVKTLLSKFMLVDPVPLVAELQRLSKLLNENVFARHFIHSAAPIITFFHIASNRIKEWYRNEGRHGSCGKGIGETAFDLEHFPDQVIVAADLQGDFLRLSHMLRRIQIRKIDEIQGLLGNDCLTAVKSPEIGELYSMFMDFGMSQKLAHTYHSIGKRLTMLDDSETRSLLNQQNAIVFEGAQGVLLDEWHGFHPHTTWSTTTHKHAKSILADCDWQGEVEVIGVMRSYATRHGAGPFVVEDPSMQNISPTEHNKNDAWQGQFRSGALDAVQLKYALACLEPLGGIDCIALTHLALVSNAWTIPIVDSYELQNGDLVHEIVPKFDHDLAYQEELTALLMQAKPVHTVAISDFKLMIAKVAEITGYPVRYTSLGARPRNKRLRPDS